MRPTFIFVGSADSAGCHPLTLTRSLADFPLANIPLRQHQTAALLQAGVDPSTGEKATLEVQVDAWLDGNDVLAFLADGTVGILTQADGKVLVRKAQAGAVTQVASRSFSISYCWDLLRANEAALAAKVKFSRPLEFHPWLVRTGVLYVKGRLQLGKGTRLLPGVVIEGDVVIGDNCKIGPHCYIRGSTSIGDGCHIGQAVEIKNSILLNQTNVGHLAYIGDSILGQGVNLGAGTISSNLRHDGKAHRSMVAGTLIETGRRKFGTIIGDKVHTGINTSIFPGRKIWPSLTTLPGAIVDRDLLT